MKAGSPGLRAIARLKKPYNTINIKLNKSFKFTVKFNYFTLHPSQAQTL